MRHTPTSSRRPGPRRWWRGRALLALAAALLLLAAACSSDDGDDAVGGDSSADEATGAPASGAEEGASDGDAGGGTEVADPGVAGEPDDTGGNGGTQPVVLTPADIGRDIVYTATVEMQADDVAATSREAQLAVTALGGFVFGQETTSDPQPRAVLVFKITPERFGDALDALGGVGEVVRQDVSADDVTERVVDLRSRIASTEVSVERLRALLRDAPSLEAIAALESQLLERETALEQMRGQLRTLEDQVALATISLTVSQPEATPILDVEVTAYTGDDGGRRCPGDDEVSAAEGDAMVLCLAIENSGNVAVTDIEVRDHRLGLDPDDVTLVDFAADDVLRPGDSITAWAPFVAAPDEQPSPDVSAVPVDESGTHLRVALQTPVIPLELHVDPDDSLPGFGDGLGAGIGVVLRLVGVAVLALGAILPLLVVVVPVAGGWWWLRQRRSGRPTSPPAPEPSPL